MDVETMIRVAHALRSFPYMVVRKRAVVAMGVLGALVGCRLAAEPGGDSSDIINGSTDGTIHDSVLLLAIGDDDGNVKGTCTATLVAPNLVLTARHCVSETDRNSLCRIDGTSASGGAITSNTAPKNLVVFTGTTAMQSMNEGDGLAARGKKVITETTSVLCDRDVAFILLDRKVNAPIAPLRLKGGAREGEALTSVGWGLTNVGKLPDHRMMRPDVIVQDVGPEVFDEESNVGLGRSEFLVGEAFCSGDSGGPSFSAKGAVVGVVSRGGNGRKDPNNKAAGCIGDDTIGFYTHLARKGDLVTRAFAASGFKPRDEDDIVAPDAGHAMDAGSHDAASMDAGTTADANTGSPNGASCDSHSECSSAACIEGTCMAQCGDAGTCPTGEACETKDTVRVCMKPKPIPADPTQPTYPPGTKGSPTPPTNDGGAGGRSPEMPAPPPPPFFQEQPSEPEADPNGAGATKPKAPASKADNSGCSAAPQPSPTSSLPWFGLALVALLARRRRISVSRDE
jgi:uncharacterized protein (TIGR03382 family)